MGLGEIGNFSAYGYAPASVVAPLGTTTVIGKSAHTINIKLICCRLNLISCTAEQAR